MQLLIKNIGELYTLEPLAQKKYPNKVTDRDLGKINDAWLAIENGKVSIWGTGEPLLGGCWQVIDAKGQTVIPGLVDNHTHPLFAGDRSKELGWKLNGETYQEIGAKGGGIQATVKATRSASDEILEELVLSRLNEFLHWGVTTCEVKSGYGLSVPEELRHLEILNRLKPKTQQLLTITCLALHAPSPEFEQIEDYIASVCQNLLPQVKAQKLADWVDVFVEQGYYTSENCTNYLQKARDLGLGIRIHADQFSNSQGAELAAKWGAASADHIEESTPAAYNQMALSQTVATILPGTSLYTKIPYTSGPALRSAECAIAVSTDFNAGSCPITNLGFVATIAALHNQLTLAETLAAITFVPAYSLNLNDMKGHLAPGADGDFLILPHSNLSGWLTAMAKDPPQVFIRGEKQSSRVNTIV